MPEALVYIVYFFVSLVITTFLPPTFSDTFEPRILLQSKLGILSEGLGKAPFTILLQKFGVPQTAFLHYLHSLDLTQLREYQSKFFGFLLLVIW